MKKQIIILLLIAVTVLGGCNFPSADADLKETVQVSLLNTEGIRSRTSNFVRAFKRSAYIIKSRGAYPWC